MSHQRPPIEDVGQIFERLGDEERDAFRGTRILVTGAGGFLGFMLMHFFAEHGEKLGVKEVLALENGMLGRSSWLYSLPDKGRIVRPVEFDVISSEYEGLLAGLEVDYVAHLASIASPVFYRKHPLATLKANVFGLDRLLDYFSKRGPRGILFFSSSEVYGDPPPEAIPTNEEYRGNVSQLGPRACYDEGKRVGESLCWIYNHEFGLPTTIVRPFNNYGPGMHMEDRRVPADFANAVINGHDIVIHSDGKPTRSYCYITDACVGYLKAMLHGRFDYFNIGYGLPEMSVLELANIYRETACSLWGYSGEVRLEPSKEVEFLVNNPSRRLPDISKAREKLNYEPVVGLREGIGRWLKYLKPEG